MINIHNIIIVFLLALSYNIYCGEQEPDGMFTDPLKWEVGTLKDKNKYIDTINDDTINKCELYWATGEYAYNVSLSKNEIITIFELIKKNTTLRNDGQKTGNLWDKPVEGTLTYEIEDKDSSSIILSSSGMIYIVDFDRTSTFHVLSFYNEIVYKFVNRIKEGKNVIKRIKVTDRGRTPAKD